VFESAVIQIIDPPGVAISEEKEFVIDTGGTDVQYNIFADQFDTLGMWKHKEGEDDAQGHSH
jgi:hypothetical protein